MSLNLGGAVEVHLHIAHAIIRGDCMKICVLCMSLNLGGAVEVHLHIAHTTRKVSA